MRKGILYSVIASESIHIFCCVLPTVFSVLSLLAGMGMIAVMPGFIDNMHHVIHDYEMPMIITSAIVLAVGWGLYRYSRKIDCHDEGTCSHAPCEPKQDTTKIGLIVATILFVFNVMVYFGLHRAYDDNQMHGQNHIENHDHNH